MLMAQITYEVPGGGTATHLLRLGDHYGFTADVVHQVLLVVVTASKKPVVVDAAGRLHPFLRTGIRALAVWSAAGG
jgi:hypothetical protein